VRGRTYGAARVAEDGGMDTLRAKLPMMYARWANAVWPLLELPGPSVELTARAAQVAADQKWESEGGSVKNAG